MTMKIIDTVHFLLYRCISLSSGEDVLVLVLELVLGGVGVEAAALFDFVVGSWLSSRLHAVPSCFKLAGTNQILCQCKQ